MPSPARIGCRTMNHRMARSQDKAVNSSMAGTYVQPDCGSAANGVPDSAYGFQAGTWPAARDLPRKQYVGSHCGRRSMCCDEIRPPNAMSESTSRTQPTIRTGPAHGASQRKPLKVL